VNFDFIRNTNAMFVPFVGPSFFSLPFADTQIWDWYYNAVSSGILRVHEGIKIKDGDGRPGTESIRVCIDRLPLEP
jgi:hypothetical protein